MACMALLVTIDITAGSRLQRIEQFEVRRLKPLKSDDPDQRNNEVHQYQAQRVTTGTHPAQLERDGEPVQFEHRYGDGARRCVERALEAMRLARIDTLSE